MALSEFVAMETAYRALQPLDRTARTRALHWLNDALEVADLLPVTEQAATAGSNGTPAGTAPDDTAPDDTAADSTVPAVSAPEPADEAPAVVESTVETPPAPAPTGRRSRRSAAKSAKSEQPQRGRRRRAATAPAETADRERVYRRMPPVEDVLTAYREIGSISGLAEHFDVPRHTVQGWARRLRRSGHEIGRNA